MAKYYSLCVFENGSWAPEFGDFDRDCVEDERQEYRDHDYKAKDLVILTCKNSSLDALVEAFEERFKMECPWKTPKQKWKSAHRDFRVRLNAMEERPLGECVIRANGRKIEYTITEKTVSIKTDPNDMQDGLNSRCELHDNFNACSTFKWIDKTTCMELRKLNARSVRLGFRLPA